MTWRPSSEFAFVHTTGPEAPETLEEMLPFRPARVTASWLCRDPMVPVAVAVMAGILLHETVPVRPWIYMLVAGCVAVAALLARRAWAATAFVWGTFLAVALASAQFAHYRFDPYDVATYAHQTPRLAHVRGVLVDDPRVLRAAEGNRPMPPKMAGLVDVTHLRTAGGWRESSGRMLLQIARPDDRLRGGDVIELFGWLEQPGPAMNAGQFDFAAFYRGRRILASLRVNDPENVDVLARPPPSPVRRFRSAARAALAAGFDDAQASSASLLKVMLLGERDAALSDVREPFRASGTSHFLAISGLHVGIVAAFAYGLIRLLGVGPRLTTLGTASVLTLYALAAEPSPPVLRATLAAVAFMTGLLLGRHAQGLQLLALAAVALLLVAPLDLYRAGFQLSFVTVLMLMLLVDRVQRRIAGPRQPEYDDPLRVTWAVRMLRAVANRLDEKTVAAVAAGLVAWVGSMPLVALHFEAFHVWAVPASVAATPLVALTLVAGLLKILLTLCVPGLAEVWATLAIMPVNAMLAVVEFFAGLPGADVPLPRPPVWLVVSFYASLMLVWWSTRADPRLPHRHRPSVRWAMRLPAAVTALAILVTPSLAQAAAPERPLRVTLLAVGAGQCGVVELPNGRVVMIDAGSTSLASPWSSAVGPFLRGRGYDTVERLFVSHAHVDHYNAIPEVVGRYGVVEVIAGTRFAGMAAEDAVGRDTLEYLNGVDVPIRTVSRGDEVALSGSVKVAVLWPPAEAATDVTPNDDSLVLRLEYRGRRIVFTGDIQRPALAALLASHADDPDLLRCDVLVAPHHGSTERETAAFLEATGATHVVASDSRRLSLKQQALADVVGDRQLLRTGSDGAIEVTMSADAVDVSAFRNRGRRTLVYPE